MDLRLRLRRVENRRRRVELRVGRAVVHAGLVDVDIGVAEVEIDLLRELVAQTGREPEAVVVGDVDRAVGVVDRRELVADTGAQGQVAVVLVFETGSEEPGIVIDEIQAVDRQAGELADDRDAAEAAPVRPLDADMGLPLIIDLLRDTEDDRVGQVEVRLDREHGVGQPELALERLPDRGAIGDTDIGALPG